MSSAGVAADSILASYLISRHWNRDPDAIDSCDREPEEDGTANGELGRSFLRRVLLIP